MPTEKKETKSAGHETIETVIDSRELVSNDVNFKQGLKYPNQSKPIEEIKRTKRDDYCHSFFSRQIRLNNDAVQRIFERSYEDLEGALHYLGIADRIAADEKFSEAYVEKASNIIEMLNDQLSQSREEIINAFNTNGIPEEMRLPQSTGYRLYKADFSTPQTYKFLDVFLKLDEMVSLIDSAWINGITNQVGYRKSMDQWIALMRQSISEVLRIRRNAAATLYNNRNKEQNAVVKKDRPPIQNQRKPALEKVDENNEQVQSQDQEKKKVADK